MKDACLEEQHLSVVTVGSSDNSISTSYCSVVVTVAAAAAIATNTITASSPVAKQFIATTCVATAAVFWAPLEAGCVGQ